MRPPSALRTRLRGLAATLALITFMLGVPALLLTIDAIPDPGDFSWSRLTAPDDGTLALQVITLVCWIAWAIFTVQLITSIISQIRGMRAPRLPGLVVPQLAADRLVAAAALLFVAIPTATTPLLQPKAEAAITAAPLPAPATAAEPSAAPAAAPAPKHEPAVMPHEPATERYTVKRGDSLWKIAEERLGDGTRYVELVDLNPTVLGGRPDFLLPGTVLRVPTRVAPAENDTNDETYRVEPGDTLSQIAEDELGNATAYPEIFDASRATVQPDGKHLRDPDLIEPGWTLTIPGHEHQAAPAPTPQPPQPPPPLAPPTTRTPPTPSPRPEPTASVDQAGSSAASSDPVPSWLLPGLAGAGGVLAGSLLLVLRQHRRTQLRYRRPGTIITPPPKNLLPVEKSAQVTGTRTAPRIEELDTALRSLTPAPRLVGATLSDTRITLTLAEPADLPTPWTGHSTSWAIELTDVPEPSEASAPYPLLASVGQEEDGALVLLNLEELRTIALTGDPGAREALGRHLAAELALNPWSRLVEVDTLGIGAELEPIDPARIRAHDADDNAFIARLAHDLTTGDPACKPDRFRAVLLTADRPTENAEGDVEKLASTITNFPSRPATALVDLGDDATVAHAVLHLTSDGRLTAPSLGLNLTAAGLSSDEAAACATLVDITRDSVPAPIPPPSKEDAVADASGALVDALIEPRPDGPAGAASLLPLDALVYSDHAATTVDDVATLAPVAAPEAEPTVRGADPELDEDLARWESNVPVAPKLTLLGPVTARVMGDATRGAHRRPYFIELLAYLCLHPGGVTAERLAADIGIREKKARDDLSLLRLWLGTDPHTGDPYLPHARKTGTKGVQAPYAVHGVLSDLDLFRRLRTRGQSRGEAGIDDLVTALHLVTGEPFTNLRTNGWGWLLEGERLDHIITSAIADVGHLVTTHALNNGDLDLADLAASTALAAAPYEDTVQLDMIAVDRALGRDASADTRLRDEILDRADDAYGPIDPPERTTRILNSKGWVTAHHRRTG